MSAKMWQGMLWTALVASGCSTNTEPSSAQPTAATGSGAAGASAGPVGTPNQTTAGSSGSAIGVQAGSSGSKPVVTTPAPVAGSSAPVQAGSSAPAPSAAGSGSTETPPNTGTPAPGFDYPTGEVPVTADLVIPAGKTVRVGPGTTFKVSMGVKVQVLGELVVQGSETSPAAFVGGGVPRSWYGLVVESGGKLTLDHAQISGASYGLWTMPGSQFSVDHSVIDTSFKAAIVQSDGTFTRTRFKASVPETVSLASEVSVDDPNGCMTIMDASPTVTDCRFDGASATTDLVRIGGQASPTFDHVYLHDAHCAFHTYGGTNTSARISNALIENFSYGFMAYTTKPIVEHSVFKNNSADFGICLGATADNAPELTSNFYSSGEVSLDPTCFSIGIADASAMTEANPSAGTTSTFAD